MADPVLIFEFIQRARTHRRVFVPMVGTVTVQEFAGKLCVLVKEVARRGCIVRNPML